MKFAVGGIGLESNTFCPRMTTLDHFKNTFLLYDEDILSECKGNNWFFGGFIDAAIQLGVELHPTIAAVANPYGPADKETFDYLTDELYQRLGTTLDGVVLYLHGGMVAENSLDPEGEILSCVREIVGDIPITCTMDMHCNISQKMVENCDAFFLNNENPHLDSYERGFEAVQGLYQIAKGKIEPVMALKKPGMLPPTLNVIPPHSGPLVELFERAFEMEKDPGVITVNIGAGFPWCDVPDAGMSVLTVIDKDLNLAEELAEELSQKLWEIRYEFLPSLVPIDEAVEEALHAEKCPVVLADVADNPGDGTTEDSNGILKELLKEDAENVGVAVICDPEAVKMCISEGVGARITLDLGCKAQVVGTAIPVTGTVKTITDGVFWHFGPLYGGYQQEIGRTVVLDIDGIDTIISERTYAPSDPEVFRRHGVEPSRKQILVVKTFKMHMEPNYDFAKKIIEVDAPGQASPNLKRYEWTRIPRPLFPVDD
jgi:microcystin degradation protein MlrC